MIVLVSVCIATAALYIFLAVASEIPVASQTQAPTVATDDHSWVRHDLEVEELVRERLYGGPLSSPKRASGGGGAGADRRPNARLT